MQCNFKNISSIKIWKLCIKENIALCALILYVRLVNLCKSKDCLIYYPTFPPPNHFKGANSLFCVQTREKYVETLDYIFNQRKEGFKFKPKESFEFKPKNTYLSY